MRLLSTTTKQKSEDVAHSKVISGSINNTTRKKQPGLGNKTVAAAAPANSGVATGSNAAVIANSVGTSEQDDFSFMNKRNAATNFQSYAQTHFSQNNREKSPGLKKSVGLNL